LGGAPETASESRPGVRTHLGMQGLLGCGLRGGTRRELAGEFTRLLRGAGSYKGSREELTPARLDWLSTVPLITTALVLLIRPRLAYALPKRGFGAHLLNAKSAREIERETAA
jgi:hypothetical protein